MGKNILEEDEGLMRPYLTSGVKTSQSTEFWSLANNAQIPMSNTSGWGVELLSCEEEYPSYLMLYYNLETQGWLSFPCNRCCLHYITDLLFIVSGYSSWEFTRFELSRHFICEYAEPENNEITSPSTTSSTTPTTTFSTTSTTTIPSTTPTSTTTPSTTLSSTTSTSTTPHPTATSTTQSSSTSTMTVTSTPSTSTSITTPIRKRKNENFRECLKQSMSVFNYTLY